MLLFPYRTIYPHGEFLGDTTATFKVQWVWYLVQGYFDMWPGETRIRIIDPVVHGQMLNQPSSPNTLRMFCVNGCLEVISPYLFWVEG